MEKNLVAMPIDSPQVAEDKSRLAGNVQDGLVVDIAASTDNPGGSTPTGGATDNTITEQAPESQPPAVQVTQDSPGPVIAVGGGRGGLAVNTTINATETPDQPRVVQTGAAQNGLALSPFTPPVIPPAAGEDADDPPDGPPGDDPQLISEPVLTVDETVLATNADRKSVV